MDIIKKRKTDLDYYHSHKEKIAARRKRRYEQNKEAYKEKNKQNYIKNRVKILAYKKKHRDKYRDRYNLRAKEKRAKQSEPPSCYLMRCYGITKKQYDAMLEQQNGLCAICRKKEINRRLAVDHNHATKQIRGLLCSLCNTALGKFDDSVNMLTRAINYLKKYDKN
ncbi:MAG TPA: hypothetical protein ENI23_06655 [bacterium]|nr:hypothetical protein [bacterium]